MKKILFLFLALALVACDNNDGYTLKFDMPDLGGSELVLKQSLPGQVVDIDSVTLDSLGFGEISGSIEKSEVLFVTVQGQRGGIQVFVDNYDYEISGTLMDPVIEVKGGPQVLYNEYNDGLSKFNDLRNELSEKYNAAASTGASEDSLKVIIEEFNKMSDEKSAYDSIFIVNNNSSVVASFIMSSLYRSFTAEELEQWLGLLDESVHTSSDYETMSDHLAKLKKVMIGVDYTDFTLPTPEGEEVSLSEYAGKGVMLIDFWASWCGPCRNANPGVVAIYNEFHDKGFDVFGVSLDRDRAAWLQAIEDDGLVWTQVFNVRGGENDAGDLYAVSYIPHTVLLDKDGKIIAKNLSEEELKEKLTELLGE